MVMLAACGAGGSESERAPLCEVRPSSEEGASLRKVLRGEDFDTQISSSSERFAEALEGELRGMEPQKETLPEYACAFRPRAAVERATFGFGWAPRVSQGAENPLPGGAPYAVNDAFGASSDTHTRMYIACTLPGDLGERSKSAWLYADASYTVNIGRTDVDQAARDRQTALTYLMARRVTDALGCENKPLAEPPVVKPAATP
ncbi:hypothetical protein [Streptomyces sp. cmx-4-9]|uniref:hypothetical protein n=1 Tax=Streptomyces sp. cmx-4-9 TaxID=2790941 RepID=UPI00397F8A2C